MSKHEKTSSLNSSSNSLNQSAEQEWHNQWDEGLKTISQLILQERRKLIPHVYDLPHDTDRSDALWRGYSRKGVLMSNGGVERSFLTQKDVKNYLKMLQRHVGLLEKSASLGDVFVVEDLSKKSSVFPAPEMVVEFTPEEIIKSLEEQVERLEAKKSPDTSRSSNESDNSDLSLDERIKILQRRIRELENSHSSESSENSSIPSKELGYNLYRTDRLESVTVKPEEIKKFLVEDGLISANNENLFAEFSLGSHEGFTRVLRCIHNDKINAGMFYPVGGYGLLVRAAATMKSPHYDVYLVDSDRVNGEKILLSDLQEQMKKHPKAKTLYLESKTMAGGVYSAEEMEKIIQLCKDKNMFLILDAAHANMELCPEGKFPDVAAICQKVGYKDFAILFTGSKTYGLERGRVGFVVFGNEEIAKLANKEMSKSLGSMSDYPFELAKTLIGSDPLERKIFTEENSRKHHFNMNLLIGYVEGVESANIDDNFREEVKRKIPQEYHNGVPGLKLMCKPQAGIQLKIDTSGIEDKYFGNVQMFNSEIFSYALHSATNLVTLHFYQLMNPDGYAMRLSFSIEKDIHEGMKRMHNFVCNALSDQPRENPYMPGIPLAKDYIFPTQKEMDEVIKESKPKIGEVRSPNAAAAYRAKVAEHFPSFMRVSPKMRDEAIGDAAATIQKAWRRGHEKLSHSSHVDPLAQSSSNEHGLLRVVIADSSDGYDNNSSFFQSTTAPVVHPAESSRVIGFAPSNTSVASEVASTQALTPHPPLTPKPKTVIHPSFAVPVGEVGAEQSGQVENSNPNRRGGRN